MKSFYILLLGSVVLLTAACGKDEAVIPDEYKNITAGSGNNSPGDGSTDNSSQSGGTYQPLTKGSTWTYVESNSLFPGETVTRATLSGKTKSFGSKTYYEVISEYDGIIEKDTSYYYAANNVYILRNNEGLDETIFLEYLRSDLPVNGSWTAQVIAEDADNPEGRITGVIKEKGASRTVQGRMYTDVIHSHLTLEYKLGNWEKAADYDIYVAKNIGVIENTMQVEFPNTPAMSFKTELKDYSIK